MSSSVASQVICIICKLLLKMMVIIDRLLIFVVEMVVESAGNETRSKVSPQFLRRLPSQILSFLFRGQAFSIGL